MLIKRLRLIKNKILLLLNNVATTMTRTLTMAEKVGTGLLRIIVNLAGMALVTEDGAVEEDSTVITEGLTDHSTAVTEVTTIADIEVITLDSAEDTGEEEDIDRVEDTEVVIVDVDFTNLPK
ncbi:hypothetical protein PBPMD00_18 [Pinkberry virus LS07-2018-MD00]|nr:hypothetical protein PBPMD00_18 [Pinkberry virus LS07-2018-MD00]